MMQQRRRRVGLPAEKVARHPQPTSIKLNMKTISVGGCALGAAILAFTFSPVVAGPVVAVDPPPVETECPLDGARRPITNPTLFDLPLARTQLRPIVIFHRLPSQIDTILGDVPVGGEVMVYALQFEYAFTDTWSLIATKDGYIDINANHTLSNRSGWANLAAGLKWNFHREENTAAALSLVYEAPTGNRSVFQGEGDGTLIPAISGLWMCGRFQFNDTLGFRLPLDTSAESTFLFASAHMDYAVTERFFPMIELSWFHVLSTGDGAQRFDSQVGGMVPAVARFEGGDVFNLGAANASDNRNLVTLGAGFRYRATDNLDLGLAYEFPLTSDSKGLIRDRVTLDAVWRF